jgi:hypothetical protein
MALTPTQPPKGPTNATPSSQPTLSSLATPKPTSGVGSPVQPPATLAPSILLLGPPGSGKTFSISTLLEAGLEVFAIITEPNGLETLLDVVAAKKLDITKLHTASVAPTRPGIKMLQGLAGSIAVGTFESLSKMSPGAGRRDAQMHKFLKLLEDFIDERTGESFGSPFDFGPDRAVVVDSLSGLNLMAWDLVVGEKPTAHQGEWGVAMNFLEKLLLTLTGDFKCPFVITGHVEREQDEITGGTKNMTSTLGRKLAPKIPRYFSEVIMCRRDGAGYYWSTVEHNTDLKTRNLPLGDKIPPTFKPLIEAYRRRLELAK